MSNSRYIVRKYRDSDFDSFLELRNEAAKLGPYPYRLAPQSLRNSLGRPNYSPQQDLLLAEVSGEVVGYLDIWPEREIGRVILYCFIQPQHRRQGLAGKLLTHAEKRAKELAAELAHVNVLESNTVAQKTLDNIGFRLIRRSYELRLALNQATVRRGSARFVIRHLQPGEEGRLTRIQNRSFTGSWGYNPNTEEEIRYAISSGAAVPEEILLACDGDRPVAYCWTGVEYQEEEGTDSKIGRISMIGVDADYQGFGMGRAVLLAGLSYLRDKGVRIAQLTVDDDNESAIALYRSVGFRKYDTSLWYEKVLA